MAPRLLTTKSNEPEVLKYMYLHDMEATCTICVGNIRVEIFMVKTALMLLSDKGRPLMYFSKYSFSLYSLWTNVDVNWG